MKLTVCLGSSCHVRGSHQVLETIQRLIQENNLEDKITLAASFCTGTITISVLWGTFQAQRLVRFSDSSSWWPSLS